MEHFRLRVVYTGEKRRFDVLQSSAREKGPWGSVDGAESHLRVLDHWRGLLVVVVVVLFVILHGRGGEHGT